MESGERTWSSKSRSGTIDVVFSPTVTALLVGKCPTCGAFMFAFVSSIGVLFRFLTKCLGPSAPRWSFSASLHRRVILKPGLHREPLPFPRTARSAILGSLRGRCHGEPCRPAAGGECVRVPGHRHFEFPCPHRLINTISHGVAEFWNY